DRGPAKDCRGNARIQPTVGDPCGVRDFSNLMNAGPFALLIADFAQNWAAQQPDLAVSVVGVEVDVNEGHPLFGELASLCNGGSASLPFFAKANEVLWCT